jgi:hypothetical protein
VTAPTHLQRTPRVQTEQRDLMNFLEIFEPGLKYLRAEKDRQKILVVKPSHGGGALLGIDLDAGTAKITIAPMADRNSH